MGPPRLLRGCPMPGRTLAGRDPTAVCDPSPAPSRRWRSCIDGPVNDRQHPDGLTSAEAARGLARLGPVEPRTSRSVASIVAGNVFTLFDADQVAFFDLLFALGLYPDAVFRFIAA